MLIYIMEQSGVIKFENNTQRNKFIQNNFNWTEFRGNENNGKSFPIDDVESQISKMKASHNKESSCKVLEKLLKKLEDTIHNFEF